MHSLVGATVACLLVGIGAWTVGGWIGGDAIAALEKTDWAHPMAYPARFLTVAYSSVIIVVCVLVVLVFVLGVMVNQQLMIKNSDGLLHNVHALPKVNTPFNMAMPANRTEADTKFGKEEGMFLVKCDVHPWMSAYVGVFSHPYFAVSGKDGKFSLPPIAPGTYEIEAWHEKMGTKTGSVTVADGKPATIDFSFAPPGS